MRVASSLVTLTTLFFLPACIEENDPVELGAAEEEIREPKVTICHIPPGNPGNAHQITVGASAVPAHLAHGDNVGPCRPPTFCTPGSTQSCYSGPAGTANVGVCHPGVRICDAYGSGFGPCVGEVTPGPEACDSLDSDCDGDTTEGCGGVCTPGSVRDCYDGPAGTDGVGTCSSGTQVCNATGTAYGACVGAVTPLPEICGDGLDDDCDGIVDDGCVCAPGSAAPCYSGPAGTDGVGVCTSGVKVCNLAGTGYGACVGEVTPTPELCGDNLDTDCDSETDEVCICAPGSTTPCYDGPAGTEGVGACQAGTATCNPMGTGYGACAGQVTPMASTCGNGVDDDRDCDGQVDPACGVGGRVWIDVSGDATELDDVGEPEPPKADIVIVLRAALTGAAVAVATSDGDGNYFVAGVPPGMYYFEAELGFPWQPAAQDVGGDDTIDNDFHPDTYRTEPFVYAGGRRLDIDLGLLSST